MRMEDRRSAAGALLAIGVAIAAPAAAAQSAEAGAPTPGCNLTGSPDVMVEGRAMLRLGDVQGCEGVRWEIVPGLIIGGQPAVRLLPDAECGGGGAVSVTADGAPVSTQGDGCGG